MPSIEKQLPLKSIFCSLGSQNETKIYILINLAPLVVPTKGKTKEKKTTIQSLSHSHGLVKKLNAFPVPVFPRVWVVHL